MSSGRNKPLLVHARDDDGTLVACVIKPRNRLFMAPREYLLEWIASALARALDLTTPEPLAVHVPLELASAVADEWRPDIAASAGLVFGSRFVGDPFTQMPPTLALNAAQRQKAAEVIVFDAFIHNPDRVARNRNLFVGRDDLLIYDHELAFAFLLVQIGGHEDPITGPARDIVDKHALRHACGKGPLDIDAFRAKIEALDDGFFHELAMATPSNWQVGHAEGILEEVTKVLRARRDALHHWLPQVMACLEP